MFSLRRHWHRFQLARELLEQHEYEEKTRIGAAEALRRLEAVGYLGRATHRGGVEAWRKATAEKAKQYPSDA